MKIYFEGAEMAIPYGKIEPVVPNSKDKNLNFAFSLDKETVLLFREFLLGEKT
jgi:hypothetical protein